MPGVSMSKRPSGSRTSSRAVVVCRPRPSSASLTGAVAKRSSPEQTVDHGRFPDPRGAEEGHRVWPGTR
ncbi:MAG: hypothetical protein M0C28_47615 [Candidatus Moduliflexus flocculans]|nr:hypothetical protein [Candidatus Moduliflexus flocculans]